MKQSDTQQRLESNTSNWGGPSAIALQRCDSILHAGDPPLWLENSTSTLWGIGQTLIITKGLERFYFFPQKCNLKIAYFMISFVVNWRALRVLL